MPDPHDVGLITRFILENPYPLGGGLLVMALVVGVMGLRDGNGMRLRISCVALLGGIAVLWAGWLVTTPGEHAEKTTRLLVEAVTGGDLTGAVNLLSADAGISVGSPNNPAFGREFIIDQLDRLKRSYTIQGNRIAMLDGFGTAGDRATVHLSCWTEANDWGATPSRWVIEVRRNDAGEWEVEHITCISINRQTPKLTRLW